MTTRTPNEIADHLQRWVADSGEGERYGREFKLPFLEAGWERFSDKAMKREIKSATSGEAITFYAQYWASYEEPISVHFDRMVTQWFRTAKEAIEFTEKVVTELEREAGRNEG